MARGFRGGFGGGRTSRGGFGRGSGSRSSPPEVREAVLPHPKDR